MSSANVEPIREFREDRGKFVEVVISAIIGGLAVGLLAAAATEAAKGAEARRATLPLFRSPLQAASC